MMIKWIKLSTDIFNNRKIKQIEQLPSGDSILVIWLKLLTLAGNINDNGLVYFTKDLPYTEEMLSAEFNKPLETIRLALEVFNKFEMIDIADEMIHVSNWERYQNVEGLEKLKEQNRIRVANYRQKQKLLCNDNVTQCNVTSNDNVTQCNAIDKDIDIEKDINNNISKHKYGEYKHVLLTDKQFNDLSKEYNNADKLIEFLDEYIEMKGYKAKNHYLCIKKWVVDAVKEKELMKKNSQIIYDDKDNPKKDIQVVYDSSKNKPVTEEELEAIKKFRGEQNDKTRIRKINDEFGTKY